MISKSYFSNELNPQKNENDISNLENYVLNWKQCVFLFPHHQTALLQKIRR